MQIKLILILLFVLNQSFGQILKDCATCSTQIIKNEQIKNLSSDEIRLLTNEIFARKGYEFENERFQNFFQNKSWYISKNNNKGIVFNEIESKNITFFQEIVKTIKANQSELVNQLKVFKNLILTDNKEELKIKFGFFYENQVNEESKSLKEVLNKINLDDINYYKSNGLNSTTCDNGFVKMIYEVAIEDKIIHLKYNYASSSEIMEDFGEFTEYHSEQEFLYNWQFEFKSNKLKFIGLSIAG